MQCTNDEQLELFADLLEPVAEILADKEIAEMYHGGGKIISIVSRAIKNHKKAVVEILARIDGVPPEEYKVNLVALPMRLVKLLNSEWASELFTLQGQNSAAASSGSATDDTKDGAN